MKEHFIKLKIRQKMFLVLLGVGVLPAVVFGFFNINSAQRELRNEILSKLAVLAESKEGQIFAYMDFLESRTGSFASDGVIKAGLEEIAAKGSKEAVGLLNQHLILNKLPVDETIIGILVMDTAGKIVAATDEKLIGANEAKDSYFREGLNGMALVELRGEEHFGVYDSFVTSAPVVNHGAGKTLGVIAIFFKTEKISEILSGKFQGTQGALTSRGGLSESTKIYLVDRDKKPLIFPQTSKGQRVDITIVDTDPVRQCLEHQKEVIGTYLNYSGEKVLGASMCLVDKNWTVLTEINAEEAFAPINRMWLILVPSSILLLAIIIIFSTFFGRKISGPIKKLNDGVEIISAGTLDYHLDIKTGDEIEQLAEAFNKMTTNLKESHEKLKEKVQEKTRDLAKKIEDIERMNKLMVGRELKMIELKKEIEELKKETKEG